MHENWEKKWQSRKEYLQAKLGQAKSEDRITHLQKLISLCERKLAEISSMKKNNSPAVTDELANKVI